MESKEKINKIQKMFAIVIQSLIDKRWHFPGGRGGVSVVENGIERLKKLYNYSDMADERIIDFVVYQIYRYRDLINSGRGWEITWCFSENAVEKYRKQFIDTSGKSGMN